MSNLFFVPGSTAAVRFVVHADSFPGLLPRLIEPFGRRDLVPDVFNAVRRGDTVEVEISCDAMPAACVHLIEGNLRQVVGVQSLVRTDAVIAMAA